MTPRFVRHRGGAALGRLLQELLIAQGEGVEQGLEARGAAAADHQRGAPEVLRHLLAKSELSGREVSPEYLDTCSLTGKRVAQDELGVSDVTGRQVIANLLRKSEISQKWAEPESSRTQLSKC